MGHRYGVHLNFRVQNKACKFFSGDMGWKMSLHRQWECVLRLKLRLMKLPDIRINKRIYVWSEAMSCKRVSNCTYKVTDMLNTLEMHPNIHNNISTTLFQIKFTKFFTDQCNKAVNKESAERGIGGNKLRTYKLFKQRYETEL